MKMIHLLRGVCIPYDDFVELDNTSISCHQFLLKLCEALWSKHDFINRAVQLERVTKQLPNR